MRKRYGKVIREFGQPLRFWSFSLLRRPGAQEDRSVVVYVVDGAAPRAQTNEPFSELDPARCDRILYQLGNEANHAFMLPLIRAFGGTAMQHDWVLFDLAVSAFPALARGGAKGAGLALREGGGRQLRAYLGNWLDRRR